MVKIKNVDWLQKKSYIDEGVDYVLNFEEILKRSKGIFNCIMYKFPPLKEQRDDLWQECSLACAKIFAEYDIVYAAYLYGAYRNIIVETSKEEQRRYTQTVSLDVPIDEGLTLGDTIPSCENSSDFELDFSIFTDEENVLIDKILNRERYLIDEIYFSVRKKIYAAALEQGIELPKMSEDEKKSVLQKLQYDRNWRILNEESNSAYLKKYRQDNFIDVFYQLEQSRRKNRQTLAQKQREYNKKKQTKS